MIKKLIRKTIPIFSLLVAVIGNTGLFSLTKTRVEKEVPLERPSYFTAPEVSSFKMPKPSLTYEIPNSQNTSQGTPKSGQFAFPMVINATSSIAVINPVVVDFDYLANPAHTISEIQDVKINIEDYKTFLATNLNKEWKGKSAFYSVLPSNSERKNTDT